jgi:hypothetical protein
MVLFVQADVQRAELAADRRLAKASCDSSRGAQTLQALYVGSEANSPVTTSARRAGVKKQAARNKSRVRQGRGPRARVGEPVRKCEGRCKVRSARVTTHHLLWVTTGLAP